MPKRVAVYFNLHKKLFSLVALETPSKGLVVAHSKLVWLRDATPRVSEAGRARVQREGRKNVHAKLVGDLCRGPGMALGPEYRIRYDPYRLAFFFTFDNYDEEGNYTESAQPIEFVSAPFIRMVVMDGRPIVTAYGAALRTELLEAA